MVELGRAKGAVNVLLVDDTAQYLRLLEVHLAGMGLNLVPATSGRDALCLCEETEFAVILMDLRMPELDGVETTRLLRAGAAPETPIICLTVSDEREDISLAYSAGAVDYIVKPANRAVVRAKVAAFVELYLARVRAKAQASEIQAHHAELQAQAEQLRAQNEELQAQAEEIQAQNEELRAQAAEIASYHASLEAQNEALRVANGRLAEAQRTIAASEAWFRALFEHCPVGVATYREGTILTANPAAARILGYDSPAELVGVPVPDVVAPECRDDIAERVGRRERGEAVPLAYETVCQRKDGTHFPAFVEATWAPLPEAMTAIVFFMDITERKKADEAHCRLAAIVDSSEDGIIGKTLDGFIQSWNPAAERLYGYSASEAAGKHISMLIPADSTGEMESILARIRAGERVEHFDTARLRKDGRVVDVSLCISPITDRAGKVVGASSIARDIRERKMAEQALERTLTTLRQFIEHSEDGIAIAAQTGAVAIWNRSMERITGLSRSEVLGRELGDVQYSLLPEIERARLPYERLRSLLSQLLNDGIAPGIESVQELAVGRPDGTTRLVHPAFFVFEVGSGFMLGSIARDVTELKLAQDALRQAHDDLERQVVERTGRLAKANEDLRSEILARRRIEQERDSFFSLSLDLLAIADIGGTLRHVSPAVERILGFAAEEMVDRSFADFIHPEDRPHVVSGVQASTAASALSIEARFLRKDGAYRWLAVAANVVPSTGLVYAVGRDVTARREMEDTLRGVNRSLRMLSDCNQALIRAKDEAQLLQNVCRTLVEVGGYRLAWVGFAEWDAAKSVRPVASVGYEEGYLDSVKVTWADTERGRGPVGAAIRTGKPALARDVLSDEAFQPWRDDAVQRGYGSLVALPLIVESETAGALAIYSHLADAFDQHEIELLTEFADDLSYGITALRTEKARDRAMDDLRQGVDELRRAFEGTVKAMTLTIERRDPYTAGHQRRVSALAHAIGAEMGLSGDQLSAVRYAALVHDIGKISVPSEVLSKPGRVNPAEFQLIKAHVRGGSDILALVDFPWPIADIVLQHHERWDGSGYPAGLPGEATMLEARILVVADVLEAMASHRPYRPALGLDAALAEIADGAGILYDPTVAGACQRVCTKTRFAALMQEAS